MLILLTKVKRAALLYEVPPLGVLFVHSDTLLHFILQMPETYRNVGTDRALNAHVPATLRASWQV